MRFVHTADWQIGFRRSWLDDDAQARFTQSRIDAIGAMAEVASQRRAQFVVVAGDVFESNQVERRTVRRALEQLARFTVPVFLLPGNHDPADAGSVYRSDTFRRHRPETVVVLDDSEPRQVGDAEVVGVPWTSNLLLDDIVAGRLRRLPPPAAGTHRIVVAHGAVDRLQPDRHDPGTIDTGVVERTVNAGALSYLALGDRHSTTPIGDSGRIWYAGAPEPTRFTEIRAGNCLVVELSDGACEVDVVPVGRWRFRQREVELYHDDDVTALLEWCAAIPDGARAIVRLHLAGVLPLRAMTRLSTGIERAAERLACLDVVGVSDDLVAVADDDDLTRVETGPVTRAALEELSAEVERGGDGAPAAHDALTLLYRAAHDAAGAHIEPAAAGAAVRP